MEKIEIYTDGGCKGNGLENPLGSYAFVILKDGEKIYEGWEARAGVTNNQMELSAPIAALREIMKEEYRNSEIVLYSDSTYVINGLNEWIHKWKKNNWKRGKDPVKNVELWKDLDHTRGYFKNLSLSWVKGHAMSDWNNYVDKLCNQAVKMLKN